MMDEDRPPPDPLPDAGRPNDDDTDFLIPPSLSAGFHRLARWYHDKRRYFCVLILFLVNLLNYMDRFTIAAVLPQIQKFYGIENKTAGVLQTVFIVAYMVFAPLFGYLGDRYNRKFIIIVGILGWTLSVLCSSLIPANAFPVFLLFRALVGIGEASYSNVAPTIIADMFTKDERSKMLMFFYIAIPFGSGLGFIVGSLVEDATGHWQWGIRLTPILGTLLLAGIAFILKEPVRGEAEGATLRPTSWVEDIFHIMRTKSYIATSLGATCVAFVAGSLSWWVPSLLIYGTTEKGKEEEGTSGLVFGIVTALSGLVGVTLGSTLAQRWRRKNPAADPLVCGLGLLVSVPFGFTALNMIRTSLVATYLLMFVGVTALSLNWSIVNDIVMYVMVPTRRATAVALQTLIQHTLGDAISPFIVGAISDRLMAQDISPLSRYESLLYAMYLQFFVTVLGAVFFIYAGYHVDKDRLSAKDEAERLQREASINSEPPPIPEEMPTIIDV